MYKIEQLATEQFVDIFSIWQCGVGLNNMFFLYKSLEKQNVHHL